MAFSLWDIVTLGTIFCVVIKLFLWRNTGNCHFCVYTSFSLCVLFAGGTRSCVEDLFLSRHVLKGHESNGSIMTAHNVHNLFLKRQNLSSAILNASSSYVIFDIK